MYIFLSVNLFIFLFDKKMVNFIFQHKRFVNIFLKYIKNKYHDVSSQVKLPMKLISGWSNTNIFLMCILFKKYMKNKIKLIESSMRAERWLKRKASRIFQIKIFKINTRYNISLVYLFIFFWWFQCACK